MAFSEVPSTWLGAGYSNSSGSHTVTMKTGSAGADITIDELTDAEADSSTGDIRKIFYALAEMMWQSYNGTASADRPTKMRFYRSTSSVDAEGTRSRTYSFTFDITDSGADVESE